MIKSLLQFTILILVFSFKACNNEPKKAAVKTTDSLSKITDTVTSGDVGEEYEEPDDTLPMSFLKPDNGLKISLQNLMYLKFNMKPKVI